MKFNELFEQYLVDKDKAVQRNIAKILQCDESYVSNIKSGHKPPPNLKQCQQIAKELNLNSVDEQKLILAAFVGRIKKSDREFLDHVVVSLPGENLDITNSFFEKIAQNIQIEIPILMDCLSNLTPEKIRILKNLCKR